MVGRQKLRRVDERAADLVHRIGRIAPPTNGNVPERKVETIEPRSIRTLQDFHAGASGKGQGARVDQLGA